MSAPYGCEVAVRKVGDETDSWLQRKELKKLKAKEAKSRFEFRSRCSEAR